jgi:phosphatidylethanolamine-binding protein (PEBP) family uncharacterized protein
MQVETNFESGSEIPEKYTCEWMNISPSFGINYLPQGTKTITITMTDTEDNFVNWMIFNILLVWTK